MTPSRDKIQNQPNDSLLILPAPSVPTDQAEPIFKMGNLGIGNATPSVKLDIRSLPDEPETRIKTGSIQN